MDAQEFLNQCTTEGNVVKFPEVQLDRPIYEEVAEILQAVQGKWKKKFKGFEFPFDPSPLLSIIQAGKRPSWRKEFAFFPTVLRNLQKLGIPSSLFGSCFTDSSFT